MSTTTIDYTAIDGTETGVQVLADIKAEIQHAQTDMALRPTYSENSAITGAWSFADKMTLDGAAAGDGWLNIIHAGVMGGNTSDNSLLIKSAADYTDTILQPTNDGVAETGSVFRYEHNNDQWAFAGDLQVIGALDLDGQIDLNGNAITGTAAPSGIWTHSVEIDMHGAGTTNKFFQAKSLTSAEGEGLAFHHDTSGDNFRLSPFNTSNVYESAWSLARSFHWDFPSDEWQVGDDTVWHDGNFPIGGAAPDTGEVLKWNVGGYWEPQPLSATGIVDFKIVDDDGSIVTMGDNNYIKFVEGGPLSINFTDTSTGSSSDPYDLTFDLSTSQSLWGLSSLTSGLLSTDSFMIFDGTVMKEMDVSVLETYLGVPSNAIEDGDFTSDGIMIRQSTGVYTNRTIVSSDGTLGITNGNGDAGNPDLKVAGIDGEKVTISSTTPSSPSTGDLWIDIS